MQRRLTIALLSTALLSIVLVGIGVVVMSRIGARADAERQIIDQLEAIGQLSSDTGRSVRDLGPALARSRDAFDFDLLEPVVVSDQGELAPLAPGRSGGMRRPRGRMPDTVNGTTDGATTLPDLDPDQLASVIAGETVVMADGDRLVGIRALSGLERSTLTAGTAGTPALVAEQQIVPLPRQVQTWLLASSGLVLLGALVAGLLLGRRLIAPIQQLRATTSAIGAGDLSARTGVTGPDEVGELGRSINLMARDLERSRQLDRQFLMSVSHDLRTPLTVITGYAEALSDSAVGGRTDTAEVGRVIETQARRLERLVGDLLDLARLDANRFRFDIRPVDPVVITGRVVAGLTARAGELGIELRFREPEGGRSPMLPLDPDRLDQIVTNLVDNALRFARTTVTVSVSVTGADGGAGTAGDTAAGSGPAGTGPTTVITVDDDGPGIASEDLPHIFERLYIGRGGSTGGENSTGLGLAIVNELAAAMGGTVDVRSPTAAGGGTRFQLGFARRGSTAAG